MELLNLVPILLMTLDGNMGHMDPDMWSHMFPFGLFFEIPLMWVFLILLLLLATTTIIVIVLLLLRQEDNLKGA